MAMDYDAYLELSDRLAELLALGRIGHRHVQCRLQMSAARYGSELN